MIRIYSLVVINAFIRIKNNSMKNKHLWVGYLTLPDKKKTLVASDKRVKTGKAKTIFLYNQARDQIIEYEREIIQPKLKNAPETDYDVAKMTASYKKALKKKLPNLYRVIFSSTTRIHTSAKEPETAMVNDDNSGNDDDIDIDDSFEIAENVSSENISDDDFDDGR